MEEKIKKSYSDSVHVADPEKDIDLINQYSLKKMNPEEVFAFNVNLCDDQPDRDLEKFSVNALQQMAKLFPGKPMISDHSWSAMKQVGRIYKADVVQNRGVNRLRGSVYMVRSDSTADIIKAVEAGILKEVSVGCSCRKRTCSECGADVSYDYMKGGYVCENGHEKGEAGEDGKPILTVLDDVADTYELSFVAVPAQPGAGVTKSHVGSHELSPEEMERRRQILLENERVIAKYQDLEKKPEEKSYDDIIIHDDYSDGSILFAFISNDFIPQKATHAAWEALGFCREELKMQRLSVRWFTTVEEAEGLGLDVSDLKTFHYTAAIRGMASRQNPNQILLRYSHAFSLSELQKTVFHEVWHTFQMKDPNSLLDEENSYWYMDDAYNRFSALSEEEKSALYWKSFS